MKAHLALAALLGGIMFAWSCASTTSATVSEPDKLVDKVEKKADAYTKEDWEEINEKFEALVDEIKDNYDTMSNEDKEKAMNAVGRYLGIYAKMGVSTLKDGLEELNDLLSPMIEGFTQEFDLDDLTEGFGE